MTTALQFEHVSKSYAGHVAVRDLSLSVPRGVIYGILGPNGAGKSTSLRMAMAIIARDRGSILLDGIDPEVDRDALRGIGYLPEERGLYRKMKVLDVIVFFAALKGVAERDGRREGERWLERMGLTEWRDAKVETLSKGMQQKVQFITTVLHEPDLLVLDEPFSGLDPVNQEVLRETVVDARRAGRTVILSTHNMEQAQGLCEHVCIIAEGRKVLDGPLQEMRRSHRGSVYAVEFDRADEAADRFMASSPHISGSERYGATWQLDLAPSASAGDLLRDLAALDVPIRRFEHVEPTLHEIFVQHVGGGAARAGRNREEALHA